MTDLNSRSGYLHDVPYSGQQLNVTSTSDDLTVIAAWPALKELFIRLNMPLPASAVAEHLLSCAGVTMNSRSTAMTYELFEQFVLLKKNKTV